MTRSPGQPIDWKDVHGRLERARRSLEEGAELSADAVRRVLESRARVLAQPLPEPAAPTETLELLEFSRGEDAYALEAAHVVEVLPLVDPTPVPFTPPAVLGVVNHRGRIIPVLDLGRLLRTARDEAEPRLVIAVEAGEAAFGIGADAVSGVTAVAAHELVAAAQLAERPDGVIRALTGGMAAVLDLDVLARDPRVEVSDEVE